MRARDLAWVVVVLAVGCLVPAYEATLPDEGQAGAGPTAGKSNSTAGASNAAGMSGTGTDCSASQKLCAGTCVEIDDPEYGCGETSCDAAACPATAGKLACEAGACVEGSCAAGSKKCDGRCVSIDDPTYGCGAESCDNSACPAPGQGTIVCNAGACEIGVCGASTKECDGKCVPLDRNNGCAGASCEPCGASEFCEGAPSACVCLPENVCVGKQCGTFTDRCGDEKECLNLCGGDTPECDANGQCAECTVADDCPVNPTNPCAEPDCVDNACSYVVPPADTACGGGTCSTTVPGVCLFEPVTTTSGVAIDATEVTRYQYFQFLEEVGADTSGQPSQCAWNDTYQPVDETNDPLLDLNKPIVGVDWCDAYAYCAHVGRRLCGKIGGGAVPYGDYNKPAVSQWMRACASETGFNAYSYGPNYYSQVCHDTTQYIDKTYLNFRPADVGSILSCETVGADGLFDMGGNVAEWEDSCMTNNGRYDNCRIRGGSFYSDAQAETQLRCDDGSVWARQNTGPGVGFRCCGG